MERIGQGPIGTFAPGSELARERKGQVPLGVGRPGGHALHALLSAMLDKRVGHFD